MAVFVTAIKAPLLTKPTSPPVLEQGFDDENVGVATILKTDLSAHCKQYGPAQELPLVEHAITLPT
jgi:hypothetical protein